MKHFASRLIVALLALATVGVLMAASPQPAAAEGEWVCFPTCSETDARSLVLAGTGLYTLAGDTIRIEVISPKASPNLEIQIFDGDTGSTSPSGSHWDLKDPLSGAPPSMYTVFADQAGNGTGTTVIAQSLGSAMPDNAWYSIVVSNTSLAQPDPLSNFYYTLVVTNTDPSLYGLNAFKIRVKGDVAVRAEAFAFIAALNYTLADAKTIYPLWPNKTTTTYNGTFDFLLDVPQATSSFAIWDGDLDYGAWDCSTNDTDDLDTSSTPPPWATGTTAVPEGAANGGACPTGSPADDLGDTNYRRSPSVQYQIIDPNGHVYLNSNPSGNSEWEQFRIESSTVPASTADFSGVGILPAGLYRMRVFGLDLQNLAAVRFFHETLCQDQNGNPCVPPRYFGTGAIGDTVWYDANGNGAKDSGEPGLPGVGLSALGRFADGSEYTFVTTADANGNYSFKNLISGTYTVSVNVATLPPGLVQTFDKDGLGTPNQAVYTLATDESRLDLDFGYRGTGSIGDRVWNDADADGVQDTGEPDVPGVKVALNGSIFGGTTVYTATTTTGANGIYTFPGLVTGTYTVTVDVSTAPLAGATQTYDLDGIGLTPNQAGVILTTGLMNPDNVDFGYTGVTVSAGSIGDRVWLDVDADGVQDAGELGIAGVTVNLLDAGGNPIATAVTDASGNYLFGNLLAGSYTVAVVPPVGLAPSYDLDGIGTPNTAAVPLTAGQNRSDVDFGYRGTGSIGDTVWYDANGNGIQEAGEPGLSGVQVKLEIDLNGEGAIDYTATATTGSAGMYTFSNLPAGSYTATVATGTLPGGATPTYDLDGTGTPNTAAVPLTAGQNRTDVDFGYRGTGSIGDMVWLDSDGNGQYDWQVGELGLGNVRVKLQVDLNGDSVVDYTTYATTTVPVTVGVPISSYLFTNLLAGNYAVSVVTTTLRSGLTPTWDLDGIVTPHVARLILAGGQNNLGTDFGYRPICPPGTGTPGYWMNHPEAWPVQAITIGGRTYSKAQAIALIKAPTKGDVTYTMFQALASAMLNVSVGNASGTISGTILSANAWMSANPVGSGVKASSVAWRVGEPLYKKLDAYNNGRLGAPSRESSQACPISNPRPISLDDEDDRSCDDHGKQESSSDDHDRNGSSSGDHGKKGGSDYEDDDEDDSSCSSDDDRGDRHSSDERDKKGSSSDDRDKKGSSGDDHERKGGSSKGRS